MSALPQPALKLDQYGRDPNSAPERLRRRKGFAPWFFPWLTDVGRLSSGGSCSHLILAIHAHACWEMKPGWSTPLPLEDWAQLSYCDIRTIQRDVRYLKERGIADVRPDIKGLYSFRLRFGDWQALESYETWKAKQKPSEAEDAPKIEDPAETVQILKTPAQVKAGEISKPFPINCAVRTVQFANPNSLDLRYQAVVQAGRLLVTPLVIGESKNTTGEQSAKTVVKKDSYGNSPRHARRVFAFSSPTLSEGTPISSTGRTIGEHPRAAELSSLFDPLLLRSCHKSLSADTVALLEACEAVGSCDHDWLVKYVIERFERPVKSPRHAKLICREANENWLKVKDLPAVTRKPPGKQHFQDQVRQLATERLRRDGCI